MQFHHHSELACNLSEGESWVDADGEIYKVHSIKPGSVLMSHTKKPKKRAYLNLRDFGYDFKKKLEFIGDITKGSMWRNQNGVVEVTQISEDSVTFFDVTGGEESRLSTIDFSNMGFEEVTGKDFDRVEILVDVLKQLGDYKYKPTQGTYFSLYGKWESATIKNGLERIQDSESTCEVCAIGSVFVSTFLKGHRVYDDWNQEDARLDCAGRASIGGGLFDAYELSEMEIAFEGWDKPDNFDKESYDMACRMNAMDMDPSTRLRTIVNNTIKHGKFSPLKEKL